MQVISPPSVRFTIEGRAENRMASSTESGKSVEMSSGDSVVIVGEHAERDDAKRPLAAVAAARAL